MKSKLAILLALTSSAVSAQELILGDLNFFQKQSTYFIDTRVDGSFLQSNIYPNANVGSTYTKQEQKNLIWKNKITYGLSDRLNVGLGIDYAFKNTFDSTKDTTGAALDKSYDNKGISDLVLSGAYRISPETVYVDVFGSLKLGIQNAERGGSSSTKTLDGNYFQGHNSLDLGIAAGGKMNKLELRAALDADYHFDGDYDQRLVGSSEQNVRTHSYLNIRTTGGVQYRFVPNFALLFDIDAVNNGKQVERGSTKSTASYYGTFNYGLTAKYNIGSSILLFAGYHIGTQASILYKETNAKQELREISSWIAGANFLF